MTPVLIVHTVGECEMRAGELETLKALKARRLITRRLIKCNRANRPAHAIATRRGREVIAMLLGQLGDVLASPPSNA
jgi:hypothetical protein